MKKTLIMLVIMFALCAFGYAEDENLSYLPMAETDGFWSPLVNPAAMSFGNANGIALAGEDNSGEFKKDKYSLFLNSKVFSYVFERDAEDGQPKDHHTFATSLQLGKSNLYIGTSYNWQNKYVKKGGFSISGLWRPHNMFSLAAGTFDNNKDSRMYRAGISFRPIALIPGKDKLLTLSADLFNYKEEDEWQKPVVSLSTEPLNGLYLSASYDLEKEVIGFNTSLSFSNLRIGNLGGFNEKDRYSHGNPYIHFTDYNQYALDKNLTKDGYYVWKLKGEIVEEKEGFNIGLITIVSKKQHTMREILDKIELLKNDKKIKGIIFQNPTYAASFAVRQELSAALLDFKAAGKKIIYYSEFMGTGEYFQAARVADRIYLHKNGSIDLKGFALVSPYLKGLLDTLGVDFVNLQSHEYKTAFNMYTYDHMTDAERESLEYLLDGLYNEMTEMISEGRGKILKSPVDEIIDNGPYFLAKKAYDEGLVDYLIYEDELEDKIRDEFMINSFVKKVKTGEMQYSWHKPEKDKIAVIYAVGKILTGKGQPGKIIGSETTAKAIRRARKDNSVKGIILRIDSGGGSAFASDVINREIELAKSENKKPVIASMSGAAASGGYYIASNADMILAEPATLTGSIGVISFPFPYGERLFDKIHVNWDTVKRGKHADIGALHRKPTEDEVALIMESINQSYDDFTAIVARGRDMKQEDVHKVAQGRVWTGKQALERNLIDEIGGFKLAVEEMKKLAELDGEVELVTYTGFDSKVQINIDTGLLSSAFLMKNLSHQLKTIYNLWEMHQLYSNERAVYLMPYQLEEN